VLVSGCEYARDLVGGLGALQGATVTVRADAVRRWLWQRIELWTARPLEGALRAALDGFGYRPGDTAAFERAVDAQIEAVILHELGEARAGAALGEGWEAMLVGFERAPAELLARAVRDNLADCLTTVPALVARGDTPAIHLWFASFEGLRRELFPRLVAGYEAWRRDRDAAARRAAAPKGALHWGAQARQLLAHAGEERAIEAFYRERRALAL
jgi:hypothetical protein